MYQSDGRVSWPVKLWYAAGQTGQSVTDFGFGTLLFIYYNQVLGLSGSYTGLGVAVALFFDALVDPAVGSWSDGFQSKKWGRRHLFMAAAIVPLGLVFFGLFWPPEGLTQMQLFLWFTLFSVLVRTALTFFNVPFLSLGAELSQDYSERTQIVAVRIAIGVFSILTVTAVGWNFFFVGTPQNPTPQLTRAPYFSYAIASAVLMMVVLTASTLYTARSIPHLAGSRQKPRAFGVRQVYRDLLRSARQRFVPRAVRRHADLFHLRRYARCAVDAPDDVLLAARHEGYSVDPVRRPHRRDLRHTARATVQPLVRQEVDGDRRRFGRRACGHGAGAAEAVRRDAGRTTRRSCPF